MNFQLVLACIAFLERRLADPQPVFRFNPANARTDPGVIILEDENGINFFIRSQPDENENHRIECYPGEDIMVALSTLLVEVDPYLESWIKNIEGGDFFTNLLNTFIDLEVPVESRHFFPSRVLNFYLHQSEIEGNSLAEWALKESEETFRYELGELLDELRKSLVDPLKRILGQS